jgi:hypothetical protein
MLGGDRVAAHRRCLLARQIHRQPRGAGDDQVADRRRVFGPLEPLAHAGRVLAVSRLSGRAHRLGDLAPRATGAHGVLDMERLEAVEVLAQRGRRAQRAKRVIEVADGGDEIRGRCGHPAVSTQVDGSRLVGLSVRWQRALEL